MRSPVFHNEFQPDQKLLHDRYRLDQRVVASDATGASGRPYELWVGADATGSDSGSYLIKLWRIEQDGRRGLERALWDRELRHLFRIASLPGAAERLIVMKDAGVDETARSFVLVLESSVALGATTPLSEHLRQRARIRWLSQLKDLANRLTLWQALSRIAHGLAMLHAQQIIHRDVGEDSVFADSDCASESLRLGGFEWSVRLGSPDVRGVSAVSGAAQASRPTGEPESFGSDWRAFGRLTARLLLGEAAARATELSALRSVLARATALWDGERSLIERLVDQRRDTRLTRSQDVLAAIKHIVRDLSSRHRNQPRAHLALFVELGVNRPLTKAVCSKSREDRYAAQAIGGEAAGSPNLPPEFSPHDTSAQREWIERDLEGARLVMTPLQDGTTRYTLGGRRIQYTIAEDRRPGDTSESWASAKSGEPGQQFFSDPEQEALGVPIRVFLGGQSSATRARILADSLPWKPFLPGLSGQFAPSEEQQCFLDFLSFTNQVEVLFRDAEIFPYRRVREYRNVANQIDYWVLEDRPRRRQPLRFAYRVGGDQLDRTSDLGRYIEDELIRRGPTHPIYVYLGQEDSVNLRRDQDEVHRVIWEVVDGDRWPEEVRRRVEQLDREEGTPQVQRGDTASKPPYRLLVKRGYANDQQNGNTDSVAPVEGFLRSEDHRGQTVLIDRRGVAIERMRDHRYLLDALLDPAKRYIDTRLPGPRLPDSAKLDDAKKEALDAVWRTRPLFALQGPPGTGKTTYVANLLGQIFADDATAQVLVTAQAHPAVDVLRQSVQGIFERLRKPGEALAGVEMPLSIRAPVKQLRRGGPDGTDPDYAHIKAAQLLEDSIAAIEKRHEATSISTLQDEWLKVARTWRGLLKHDRSEQGAGKFLELVRRAANLTYCTSTSQALAGMDQRGQTFDWSIIEEAGKAHGFDLALPLRLGHRWVLIGDHFQLQPFRHANFLEATATVDVMADIIDALEALKGGGGLVDRELIARWNRATFRHDNRGGAGAAPEHLALQVMCKDWLRFFAELHRRADAVVPQLPEAQRRDAAPLAMTLDRQHRMHPLIAELVSRSFYETKDPDLVLKSETRDAATGQLLPRVRHAFAQPRDIAGKAVVWLDVPRLPAASDDRLVGRQRAPEEVKAIARFLRALRIDDMTWESCFDTATSPMDGNKNFKLAVLSPYAKQVGLLKRKLNGLLSSSHRPAWLRRQESDGRPVVDAYVHTVDSYQGNEADVVIVSLVRNIDLATLANSFRGNRQKVPEAALGFLREDERMNVLASRAERLLVLCGCWTFFFDVTRQIDGRRGQPMAEWRVFIDFLAEQFGRNDDGAAYKIPVDQLKSVPSGPLDWS